MSYPIIIPKCFQIETTTNSIFSTSNPFDAILRELTFSGSLEDGAFGVAFDGDHFNQTFATTPVPTVNDLNNFNIIALGNFGFDSFQIFHPNLFVARQRVINMWVSSPANVTIRGAFTLYWEIVPQR